MKMKNNYTFLLAALLFFASSIMSQNLTGIKICVNPGHGGFDSDDRNVVIAPYTSGDPNGFWESQSNLDKGKQLRDMLQLAGASVIITRTTNTTADDLNLSVIVAMANQNNADFLLSIHSNAGSGVANNVLMLHAGADLTDTNIYNTYDPNNAAQKLISDKSRDISTVIAKNLYENQITTWSSGYSVRGEKTFARTAMGFSDGYGVMRGVTVPGVISEGMMHDYIPETYRLMNMEYKWLEAWNFFKSFCTYFKPDEKIANGNIAGSIHDSRNLNTATYYKLKGKDELLHLNGAKLTVIETNTTYTVDNMNNGIYVFKNLAPGTYNVKAEATGYYSQTIPIVITAGNTSYLNINLNKVRNTPPQVVSYKPNVAVTDSVECSTTIELNFNWDMDVESTSQAFSISPAVAGTLTFEDSQYRLRFTPTKPLDVSTVYTVKLAKTAKHPDNLSMTDDFTFQFKTKSRNQLKLLTSYPYQGNIGVYTKPLFRFVFDNVLNTSNLLTAIKVLDKNGVELAKNSRTFLNNTVSAPNGSCYFELTNALTANMDYKIVISNNVADQVGVLVGTPIEINFKTSSVLVDNQPLMNTFETASFAYDAAQSVQVTSAAVSINSSKKLFGSYSNLLNYTFAQPQAYATFTALNPTITATKDKVIGLHVYGDLSGNEMQLQFTSGTDVKYVKMCDLNFFGWEFKEVKLISLSELTNYQLTDVKLIRNNGVLSLSGEVYFDNMLLYDALIQAVPTVFKNMVRIYPNPTSDIITVAISSNEQPVLQLYSLNSVLLKECSVNTMKVSDIAPGTYILKVKLKNNSASYPVLIVR